MVEQGRNKSLELGNQFEMFYEHLSGNVDSLFEYKSWEFKGEAKTQETNLAIFNICMVFKQTKTWMESLIEYI